MTTEADQVWQISEAQAALVPDVSGNDINGLGEQEFRRPGIADNLVVKMARKREKELADGRC